MVSEQHISEFLRDSLSNHEQDALMPEDVVRSLVRTVLAADQPWYVLTDGQDNIYQHPPNTEHRFPCIPVFSHSSFAEDVCSLHSETVVAKRLSFPDVLALFRCSVFRGMVISYDENICDCRIDPWELMSQIRCYLSDMGVDETFELETGLRSYFSLINMVRYQGSKAICCLSESQSDLFINGDAGRYVDIREYLPSESAPVGLYMHYLAPTLLFYLSGDIRVSLDGFSGCCDDELLKSALKLSGVCPPVGEFYVRLDHPYNEPAESLSVSDLQRVSVLDISRFVSESIDEPTEKSNETALLTHPETENDSGASADSFDEDVFFDFEDAPPEKVVDVTKDQSYYRSSRKEKSSASIRRMTKREPTQNLPRWF